MQCACAILLSAACHTLQYFLTLSHKRHDFRGRGGSTEHTIFVLNFYRGGQGPHRADDDDNDEFLYRFSLKYLSF